MPSARISASCRSRLASIWGFDDFFGRSAPKRVQTSSSSSGALSRGWLICAAQIRPSSSSSVTIEVLPTPVSPVRSRKGSPLVSPCRARARNSARSLVP
jgi:hypothetical protein